jgi:hypothetical protein
VADLVEDFRLVLEREEAVGEAFRHVERVALRARQLHARPAAVARRFGAQVDDHVVEAAARAADQLGLGVRRGLEVHAAQRPPARVERDAALGVVDGEALLPEGVPAEAAGEEAPLVRDRLELHLEGAGERQGPEDHAQLLAGPALKLSGAAPQRSRGGCPRPYPVHRPAGTGNRAHRVGAGH